MNGGTGGAAVGLAVHAEARWPPPDDPGAPLPPVPRFEASAFAPLLVTVADRCLTARYGAPPVPPEAGRRIALVLAAARGDVVTQTAIDDAVAGHRPVPKELLFQNVPSTALGHVAVVWGLTGPLLATLCVGPADRAVFATAGRLVAAGDADLVLAVAADPTGDPADPGTAVARLLGPRPIPSRSL
ncbi:hypothetical protein GCM10010145_51920 [Streptomyces ruber]|uniref:Beta-ketoacyl synthase N-terminal domain-containing protein n=2 Tax=Streptomyces TaxID=1883 RepID=A0A918BLR5_9ACTN|nr:hypothetical protein [Streptomyces ruber]GGQ75838.1 hypothetical protein GCM10010145_51920 [Streptomyces ruber]